MSELIHIKDRGIMKAAKYKDSFKCSKCGFIVLKSQIHHRYQQGILEIPI